MHSFACIQVFANFDIALDISKCKSTLIDAPLVYGRASTKALLSRVCRSSSGATYSHLNRHHHDIDDGALAEDAVASLADSAHDIALSGFFIHALIGFQAIERLFRRIGQLL